MSEASKLDGRTAMVTGASRGLGKDISIALARAGAAVACVARNLERAEETAITIRRQGGRALAVAAHVEQDQLVEEMFLVTEARLGPLDILVNNVGIARRKPILEMTEGDWNEHFDINAKSVFLCSKRAARSMIERGAGGAIINISSIAGQNAFPSRLGYCASKAAVNHMTRVMAIEWAANGIRVNASAPGYILTEAIQWFAEKRILDIDALKRRTPIGHLGEGKDVGAAAVYLASDEAKFITGSILTVDGGWTAYGYL
jgi:NAD(P)-dependent dehydrogenase (short-subunit alcohol dehydrogenase family)